MDNRVTWLRAANFRNFESVEVEFQPGLNMVVGLNGHGKTSLLEAIHLIGCGRLLRPGRDSGAVRNGYQLAQVAAELPSGTRLSIDIRVQGKKTASVNSNPLPRASDLIGRLPMASFCSMDLSIVRGEPSDRRLLMDTEISQLSPAYLRDFSLYKKTLQQRNALLKGSDFGVDPHILESYDEILSKAGSGMRLERQKWVSELAELAAERHAQLGSGEQLVINYEPKEPAFSVDELVASYRARHQVDQIRGTTTVGPHRDDLKIEIAGLDARTDASQGQQRSAVIAIKLSSLHLIRERFDVRPLLLLDDVFSDLDPIRREQLMSLAFAEAGQAFLTCTDTEQVERELVSQATVFRVDSGKVVAA